MNANAGIRLVALSLALAACGDDPVAAESFEFAGAWTYSATSLIGILPEYPEAFPGSQNVAATCSVSPTPIVVSGSAAAFGGQFQGLVLSCELRNEDAMQVGAEVIGPVAGAIRDGVATGDSVQFSFVPATDAVTDWSNEGEVAGTTASGRVSIRATIGGELIDLNGRWSTSRN